MEMEERKDQPVFDQWAAESHWDVTERLGVLWRGRENTKKDKETL